MRHFWAVVSMNPIRTAVCASIYHYPHPSPDPNPNPIPNPKPNRNPKSYPNVKLFNELAPIPTTQYVRQLNDVKAMRLISRSL